MTANLGVNGYGYANQWVNGGIGYFNFDIFNYGDTASGAFSSRAYLSLDGKLDQSDILIADIRTVNLAAGEGASNLLANVARPFSTPAGYYTILIQVDYLNEVNEFDPKSGQNGENDNIENISQFGGEGPIEVKGASIPLQRTELLFKQYGELAVLSAVALSAYHLIGETIADKFNDVNSYSDTAYTAISGLLRPLTVTDLPGLAPTRDVSGFGPEGLRGGIYVHKNAAAYVSRSKDALFLSFRGTNDNAGEAGLPTNTPDEWDWLFMHRHFKLFDNLFAALETYVGDTAHGIRVIYVAGHSLGGGMVEAFMDTYTDKFAGVTIQAQTFASSGYGIDLLSDDPRICNLWIKGDPILAASKLGDNEGDENVIYHNLGTPDCLHSMALYALFVAFLKDAGIGRDELAMSALHGVDYDNIFINVVPDTSPDPNFNNFLIGGAADVIIITSNQPDIILGGADNDVLSGRGGRDYIDGGTENDQLSGGKDDDFLYGGAGSDILTGGAGADEMSGGDSPDVFVFLSFSELGQDNATADIITDFKAAGQDHDTINLSGVDAVKGFLFNEGFTFVGTNAFSHRAGELRFEFFGPQTWVLGDTDGNGTADMMILLYGNLSLRPFDFIL